MQLSLAAMRFHRSLIFLLLISVLIIWSQNIQSVRYLDHLWNNDDSQHYLIQKQLKKGSIQRKRDNELFQKRHNPVPIPSRHKKHLLKQEPPQELDSILTTYPNKTYTIKQDISSYLSFALIGVSKTGTTSLLKLLSNKTAMLEKERCDLMSGDAPSLLKSLHDLKQKSPRALTGLKCPQELWNGKSSIQEGYKKYFNKTKLVIGIRHPVLWFESMYNFKVRNLLTMPPTNKLPRCVGGSHGVCAWRMNLPDFMSWLNKTPMNDDEMKFMMLKEERNGAKSKGSVGPVFLYEMKQIEDREGAHAVIDDLAEFLGIEEELPSLPHISTSGVMDFVPGVEEFTKERVINICDEQHAEIHHILMRKAKISSEWILKYFLKSNDVHVSSPHTFANIMANWEIDPCIERRRISKRSADAAN